MAELKILDKYSLPSFQKPKIRTEYEITVEKASKKLQ